MDKKKLREKLARATDAELETARNQAYNVSHDAKTKRMHDNAIEHFNAICDEQESRRERKRGRRDT